MLRVLALQALLAASAQGAGEPDWFASLYTAGGLELRPDDRVFTLFALFNAVGFDQGELARREPVPRVVYTAVREQVRARVASGDPEVRALADEFFDAHPGSIAKYLSAAVQGRPPGFEPPPAAGELKGLSPILAKAWTGWALDALIAEAHDSQREALKGWLPLLDAPIGRARAALRLPGTLRLTVIGNLLDAPDAVRVAAASPGELFIVVGPSEAPSVEAMVRELARAQLAPVIARQVDRWEMGSRVLREARAVGAQETSVREFAISALSTAVALKAIDASEAQWAAAAAGGYQGIKDAAELLDDAKPLDGWALDAMHTLETRRPAKK